MAIFCTIYYILAYAQSIPQIIKLLKTKSSNDYSLGMVTMQFISIALLNGFLFALYLLN